MSSDTTPPLVELNLPESFPAWRLNVTRQQRLPLIAVVGTRGKSTVVRLIDHIFRTAGVRTATWTDTGVEVNGQPRPGELAPWQAALADLSTDIIDVAIQELDWPLMQAVGLPEGVYPVLAATNICGNSDVCLAHDEARLALDAYPKALQALADDGLLVVNAEDYAIAGPAEAAGKATILVGQRPDTPLLRHHLERGGIGAWTSNDTLRLGSHHHHDGIVALSRLGFALHGAATFEIQDALLAAAVATGCGIDITTIGKALCLVPESGAEALVPGSFNVVRLGQRIAVIERPLPSWFLKPVLRALAAHGKGRLIAMLGSPTAVPADDLIEIGRLLGRSSAAIVLDAAVWEQEQSSLIKQGVVQNDVPPVLIHVSNQERGVNRALKLAGREDTVLFLSEEPASILSQLRDEGSLPQAS
ncbi:MAG: hypothetical protein ACR2LS_05270 [Thermomicrobiales bacterium]